MNQTMVEHPRWCDPARCTVTPAAAAGEAHHGRPVTVVAAHGIAVPLRSPRACTSRPRGRWPARS